MMMIYNLDESVTITSERTPSKTQTMPPGTSRVETDAVATSFANYDATVPQIISDRQFFQQLAVQGIITQDEAIAAVSTGTIPSEMAPLIAGLPATQQFAAKMMLSGATQFDRNAPLTLAIGQAYGWTSVQLDALWLAASAL